MVPVRVFLECFLFLLLCLCALYFTFFFVFVVLLALFLPCRSLFVGRSFFCMLDLSPLSLFLFPIFPSVWPILVLLFLCLFSLVDMFLLVFFLASADMFPILSIRVLGCFRVFVFHFVYRTFGRLLSPC